jgi:hypothetical protein
MEWSAKRVTELTYPDWFNPAILKKLGNWIVRNPSMIAPIIIAATARKVMPIGFCHHS